MVRGINGPWIGFRNYELVLTQSLFWESVLHNLQLLLAIPAMVVISLLVSILLYERVAGWKHLPHHRVRALRAGHSDHRRGDEADVPVQRAGERSPALAQPRFPGARLDRLLRRGAVDRDDPDHLARVRARHHPVSRPPAQPRRVDDRGRAGSKAPLVAARLVHHPAADARRHRILRGGERHHHAGRGVCLCLRHGRRPRRARHLHHGGRTLHLQCPDPHQPAGHCLGGLGAAVPGLGSAHIPALQRKAPGTGAGGDAAAPNSRRPAMRSSRAFSCSPPSWLWCRPCSWC